jgi:hypothetical protein
MKETLEKLRDEASEVKRCYTDYSFKALLLATAFFGFIAKFYPDNPEKLLSHFLLWLLCATVVGVVLIISRIGYHKYSTANRNYGFELHVNRTKYYEQALGREGEKLESRIRNVGWEEAMCAWRIVQPVLFERIYYVSRGIQRMLIPLPVRERSFKEKYLWWNTKCLINRTEDGTILQGPNQLPYHPGRFLRNTQVLLHTLCIAVYIVWIISYVTVFKTARDVALEYFGYTSLNATIFVFMYWVLWLYISVYLFLTMLRHHSRRLILENGLLSIQSCAVVWRLVTLAHLKAVEDGLKNELDYRGYSRRLAYNACIIRDNLFDIHQTIMKNDFSFTNINPNK